jgi:hypothetical protein
MPRLEYVDAGLLFRCLRLASDLQQLLLKRVRAKSRLELGVCIMLLNGVAMRETR